MSADVKKMSLNFGKERLFGNEEDFYSAVYNPFSKHSNIGKRVLHKGDNTFENVIGSYNNSKNHIEGPNTKPYSIP